MTMSPDHAPPTGLSPLGLATLSLLQCRLWDQAVRLHRELAAPSVDRDGTRRRIDAVFRALDCIDEGRYGVCGACDVALSPDLLLARPTIVRCTACDAAS